MWQACKDLISLKIRDLNIQNLCKIPIHTEQEVGL